jgi:hypothetical protein
MESDFKRVSPAEDGVSELQRPNLPRRCLSSVEICDSVPDEEHPLSQSAKPF